MSHKTITRAPIHCMYDVEVVEEKSFKGKEDSIFFPRDTQKEKKLSCFAFCFSWTQIYAKFSVYFSQNCVEVIAPWGPVAELLLRENTFQTARSEWNFVKQHFLKIVLSNDIKFWARRQWVIQLSFDLEFWFAHLLDSQSGKFTLLRLRMCKNTWPLTKRSWLLLSKCVCQTISTQAKVNSLIFRNSLTNILSWS